MSKEYEKLVDIEEQRCRDGGSQRTVSCFYNSLNYQRPCEKRTRNIVFVKQKVINNLVPLETDEKLQKSFIDNTVNTDITGPLANDDSVTMVRKLRNYNYGTYKVKTKLVQTINYKLYSFSDKASWQRVPTADCGTQVIEAKVHNEEFQKQGGKESPRIRQLNDLQEKVEPTDKRFAEMTQIDSVQSNISDTDLRLIDMALQDYLSHMDITQMELEDTEDKHEIKTSFSGYSKMSNVKRWALSSNLTRGPDF